MTRRVTWLLAVVTVLVTSAAVAQDRNHLYDKFQLIGGGTYLIYSTTIRIDPEGGGDGTEIDAEDVLGLDKTNFQPRLAGRFRMGRRHELEGGFQWADRNAEKTLSETIEIGDSTFDAGLTVRSKLNTSQAFLTYRYAFMAKEKTMIGAALGLGPIFLDEEISAEATVGGNTAQRTQSESFVGPTASIGLFGRFRVGTRWYIEADARFLYLKVSNIKGEIFDGGAAVRYFISDKFGAELGYGIGSYAVTLSRDGDLVDLSGKIKYSAQGVRIGLIWAP